MNTYGLVAACFVFGFDCELLTDKIFDPTLDSSAIYAAFLGYLALEGLAGDFDLDGLRLVAF